MLIMRSEKDSRVHHNFQQSDSTAYRDGKVTTSSRTTGTGHR
jgi:hypothetical protein